MASRFGVPASFSGRATLASAVAQGISVGSWKTKPISRVSAAPPGHSIRPAVASAKPATILSKVDLPQPDGPSKATKSPPAMSRSIPRTARVPER